MSAAEKLKGMATAICNQMRDRKVMLQAEYDDLQSKLAQKKFELDSHVDFLSMAYQRALDFRPVAREKFLCPRCWVVNGKESEATAQGNIDRCGACHEEFHIF